MDKHTPGPWKVFPVPTSEHDNCIQVMQEVGGRVVASAYGPVEHRAADARLIAAAPDILKQLRRAEAVLSGFYAAAKPPRRDPDTDPFIGELRAAIAKAEGGES